MIERIARKPKRDRPADPPVSTRVGVTPRATSIQTKLAVGPAGDRYEREADVVADQVVRAMRAPGPALWNADQQGGRIQPMTGTEAPGSGDEAVVSRIQRMPGIGAAGGEVDAATEQEIKSSSGGGRPLPAGVRASVEPAFGADFGNVRVHEGARATELNDRIQAKAFTTGSDIHFRDGFPDMSSGEGQHLLAHELTHTIQQGAVGPSAQRTSTIQRFLDPAQQQKLATAEGRLKALLQTPKGKGKGATNRKEKIDALRVQIEELKATDRSTPGPAPASGASLAAPSVQEGSKQKTTSDGGGSEVVPQPEPEPVVEPVVEQGPDLTTESLRDTKAELAAHRLKTPGKRSRGKHNKKTEELEAKVAELDAEILKQHPAMSAAIGQAAAQDISNAFEPSGITELGKVVPAKEMERLCATIGADKLRTLADAYGVKTMWLRIQQWTAEVAKNMLTTYSAVELVAVEKAIGIDRFKTLVTTWKVPAAAIKHYGNTFMRTFAGATDTTWQHLITIGYNARSAISGGHDRDTFYKFALDEGVGINWTQTVGSNEKVNYTTYWPDGTPAQTGSKTLIPGLTGKKAIMMADVNNALWNSIAKQEFRTDSNAWEATTRDGTKTFSGFYRNGNIDTFFPVG